MSNYDCGTDSEPELTPTRRYATLAAGKLNDGKNFTIRSWSDIRKLNMEERTTVDVGMSPSQKMMWLKLSKAAYDAHLFPDRFFDSKLMLLPTVESYIVVSDILYDITPTTFVEAMGCGPEAQWIKTKDAASVPWSICTLVLKFGNGMEQVVYVYWRSKHLHGTEEIVYHYWRCKSSTGFTLTKAEEPTGGLDGDIAVICTTPEDLIISRHNQCWDSNFQPHHTAPLFAHSLTRRHKPEIEEEDDGRDTAYCNNSS
ncbi:hypothetical protein LTR37_001556 [Vermiconidia calcicola]|uniref:Uncharacterized protein n=1 Tax=Vermiconidia calcicola TaxID=1690605 RepID=A0ACC3NV66_9PEZI|nr:hypothetical protein LTR37_001556 [Vermiconidia calcicola]